MRVLLFSDPHYDFHARTSRNFFLEEPSSPVDAIVVAGDVANTAPAAEAFFALFNRRFPGVERYYVLGNHCAWIGPHARSNPAQEPCVHEIARRHGLQSSPEQDPWCVSAGVLLFDLFYPPRMTAAQIHYTVDDEYMDVRARQREVATPPQGEPVRFSVSHMVPNVGLPTKYRNREPMFYNPSIDLVLRAFRSPVHLFGHTHEWVDAKVDGVRYVNRPVGYDAPRVRIDGFVVEW